ncbi:MAG TPA: DUF3810 domain-containing protein, partial [Pricia sp.]|nr:DUF3810 domain-containing protein [Pricia sp.]
MNAKNPSKLRNGIALSLIPQVLVVLWLGSRPDLVETYYSKGIYVAISQFFRILYGWIPFSFGELVYVVLVLLAIRYIYRNWRKIRGRPWRFLRDVLLVLSVFYFTFNVVWAINYYRKPIAEQFAIRDSIRPEEVLDLTERLIVQTNRLQLEITGDSTEMVRVPYDDGTIFAKTIENYHRLEKQFPFMAYDHPSLKKSNSGALMGYLGIGGYLNPFTNEAQVNGLTPAFRLPVVTAHEIGHQIGYSKENETNFIGYFVTMKNPDIYFRYSASAFALSYCLSAVRRSDEALFERLFGALHMGVQKNYQEL